MQGMPVRDKGLSVSLQANKYYMKHINGLSGLTKCLHYLHTGKITNQFLLNYLIRLYLQCIHQPTDFNLSAPTQLCVTLAGYHVGTGNLLSEERNMGMRKRGTL